MFKVIVPLKKKKTNFFFPKIESTLYEIICPQHYQNKCICTLSPIKIIFKNMTQCFFKKRLQLRLKY